MPTHLFLKRAEKRIERRIFLKALALGLAVPVAAKMARIATAAQTAPPKRLLVFFMPHGVAPEHWNPQVSASDNTNFALDMTGVSILGPLEPYKSYVNVYQGFQYDGAAATHTGIVNCLSGASVIDTTTARTSFEHVIAKALGVQPLILGACSHQPYGLDSNGMLFWDGTPVDPQKSPVVAADTLFGSLGQAPEAGTQSPDMQLQNDLLALTSSEIQSLQTQLSGLTNEQTKLATHLAAIQALQSDGGASGGAGAVSCTMRPSMPTVEMVRSASAGQVIDSSGGNDYFYQEQNFQILLQAQMEVVTQAIICNAAQVIGLMPMYATCDFDFTFAGAPGSHHTTLSHTGPQAAAGAQYNSPIQASNYDTTTRQAFATAQRWFCQQLVDNVVSVLATTMEPGGSGYVLDNTLIYWMSEIGDGAMHTRVSEIEYPQVPTFMPLVSIGKCGGAIKTQQIVQSSIGTDPNGNFAMIDRSATDIYLTLAQAMGVPNASFPNTTGVISGVLT
jgi:hypothetical protein